MGEGVGASESKPGEEAADEDGEGAALRPAPTLENAPCCDARRASRMAMARWSADMRSDAAKQVRRCVNVMCGVVCVEE